MMSISPDHFTEMTAVNDEHRADNQTSNTVGSNNRSDLT